MPRMRRLFDHLDLRVKNLAQADAFYRELLPTLGFPNRNASETSDWVSYEREGDHPTPEFISIIEDPKHAPNATRVAFWAESREAVEALAPLLQRIGAGRIEGPEFCPEYSPEYYAVFFEDPSGNRLEVCCRVARPA